MSQTPPFTIYEPPRYLEKGDTLYDKIADLENRMIHMHFKYVERENSVNCILDMLKKIDTRIEALEKKEISER